MYFTRRIILKALLGVGLIWPFMEFFRRIANSFFYKKNHHFNNVSVRKNPFPVGVDKNGFSHVYMSKNGTPEQNIHKVIDLIGGINQVIEKDEIVVLKTNSQWWNQGMTNTDAIKTFIDMVLSIVDFNGEIIIADNHQFKEDNSLGWTTEERNGSFNYNELIDYFHEKGHLNVTKSHWHVAGKTSQPLQGDAQGNKRVNGPQDGDGYVWLLDNYYLSPSGRKCIMTYPVFTSSYSGLTVDLKNGVWENGHYVADKKVKFINFSALNYHSYYCGVTASVKNLMGVVDMSCGYPGDEPQETFNTHHIGVSKIIRLKKNKIFTNMMSRMNLLGSFIRYCYHDFHHTSGSLGYFIRNVRMPDLNIITAENVGWGSRINKDKAFQAKTILASTDPVALDYIAARDVLLPGTPADLSPPESILSYCELNNPDNRGGPFWRFLKEANKEGVGTLDPDKIIIHKVDIEYA